MTAPLSIQKTVAALHAAHPGRQGLIAQWLDAYELQRLAIPMQELWELRIRSSVDLLCSTGLRHSTHDLVEAYERAVAAVSVMVECGEVSRTRAEIQTTWLRAAAFEVARTPKRSGWRLA